jgi:hypothetical protein
MTACTPVALPPHGSPRDRGRADSYYHRAIRPHKWLDGIGRVEVTDLTAEEIAEYHAGYQENEDAGEFKEWGDDDYGDGEFDE